jgi:hypothetical protein
MMPVAGPDPVLLFDDLCWVFVCDLVFYFIFLVLVVLLELHDLTWLFVVIRINQTVDLALLVAC